MQALPPRVLFLFQFVLFLSLYQMAAYVIGKHVPSGNHFWLYKYTNWLSNAYICQPNAYAYWSTDIDYML